jgi:hypothetical protein
VRCHTDRCKGLILPESNESSSGSCTRFAFSISLLMSIVYEVSMVQFDYDASKADGTSTPEQEF